jgi:catechol 2,3-dioxygenase-like lactoylglutathione lyase family enzyme
VIPARVSVVTLGARDLPTLRRFYKALGWPENDGANDEFTAFKTGGAVLAIWSAGELEQEAGATPGAGGFALSINVDRREEVDEVIAAMVDAGATLRTPPEDKFWGGRSGNVADPEGNPWEVAWNPHWPLDERGTVVFPG